MRNILLVAKREYQEKIRSRAFRFSTLAVPLLLVLILGGSYLTGRNAGKLGEEKHIAISCKNQQLAAAMRDHLLEDKDRHSIIDLATEADRDALRAAVQNKTLDGLLTIDEQSSAAPTVVYLTRASSGIANTSGFASALSRALAEEHLVAQGMNHDEAVALFQKIDISEKEVDRNGKVGESTGMAPFNKAMMVVFLITMPVLIYGMDMARNIIEEKSSRIFEVMLSVASPADLLTGKMLGVCAVGLTQVAIWVAMAAAATGSSIGAAILSGNLSIHFSITEAIFFPVFFVLGFLLYSAIFSGLAATCETAQDLQMYSPIAIVPVWVSMGILPMLLSDPNSKASVIASLVPFTSPFVMVARMSLQPPPIWQLALSLLLVVLTIWAMLWFSAKLYRVGILMYGKRATLPEILRWLRYS